MGDLAPTGQPTRSPEIISKASLLAAKIGAGGAVEPEHPIHDLPWCRKFAAKFRNVLSPTECAALIKLSEDAGYERALVNVGGGRQKLIPDYRNSHRVMIDSPELARALFHRIQPLLEKMPTVADNCGRAFEFNERLRFLQYTGGEFFERHCDGSYIRPRNHPRAGDRSFLTVLVYLNADYDGATRLFNVNASFSDDADDASYVYDVEPEVGMVFVHDHRICHSGQPVNNGTKYAIRTDIMFTTRSGRCSR